MFKVAANLQKRLIKEGALLVGEVRAARRDGLRRALRNVLRKPLSLFRQGHDRIVTPRVAEDISPLAQLRDRAGDRRLVIQRLTTQFARRHSVRMHAQVIQAHDMHRLEIEFVDLKRLDLLHQLAHFENGHRKPFEYVFHLRPLLG